ncbi:A/G-specific adenine glycosylase [Candidatus Uhrbacteria bacterium]|nr:A/G-specific adenine glycosylase [Candidatus Uhrbacteria bacterium]
MASSIPPSYSFFRRTILTWYRKHGRHDLPWRTTRDPYNILVSEVMLQQTQIPRVIQKYREFLRAFPTLRALAAARARDVLSCWQGLGYNRRGLYLQRATQQIMDRFHGTFPKNVAQLESLPGIGPYTARAVAVFSWNSPELLLETNIRRVMLHFFFPDQDRVPDSLIEPLLQKVLYKKDPRTWYWALMDYGAGPLRKIMNPNRRSKHYSRQSKFEGSRRYVRAKVVSLLLSRKRAMASDAIVRVLTNDTHCKEYVMRHGISEVLDALVREGMIQLNGRSYAAA